MTIEDLSDTQLNEFVKHLMFSYFTGLQDDINTLFFERAGFTDVNIQQWMDDAELEHKEFLTKKMNGIEDRFKKQKKSEKVKKEVKKQHEGVVID